MSDGLEDLLRHPAVWRVGDASAPRGDVLSSGFSALDAVLPGGGWPRGAVTEMLAGGEGAAALGLLTRALSRVSGEGGWIVCIASPHLPYAPAFEERGVDASRLLVTRGGNDRETLWAAEQALKSSACGAVLLWEGESRFSMQVLRRLQLAAESNGGLSVLFRPPDAKQAPSAAALRLFIEPRPAGFSVTVLKSRGGAPGKRVVITNPE
ncbi:MAG: translesion DNA synthesis-associated protein ImuA, partial [Gammaproteobacteria bacterium]|nr:translesion DNA synthesis-associated protein ImuA [Gammaproteobacteria bacterium]